MARARAALSNPPARARVASYFDNATAGAFYDLSIPSDHPLGQATLELARGDVVRRGHPAKNLGSMSFAYLMAEAPGTRWHEWHHFLQTLAYPFQYVQMCRHLAFALGVVNSLQTYSDQFEFRRVPVEEQWLETHLAPARLYRVVEDEDGLGVARIVEPKERDDRDICEIELLEEATNIFVYRAEDGPEDGSAYSAWLRRGGTKYEVVFRLLSRLLGEMDAYLALGPLVQAAFFTTEPCAAFVMLVNLCLRDGLRPSLFGVDDFYASLLNFVSAALPSIVPDALAPRETPRLGKLFRITMSGLAQVIEEEYMQVARPIARKYVTRLREEPATRVELLHPMTEQDRVRLWQDFSPPVLNMQLHVQGQRIPGSTMMMNRQLFTIEMPSDHPWKAIAKEAKADNYFTLYIITQRMKDTGLALATSTNDRIPHRCVHKACPYYATNACRRWFPIPDDWRTCTFPGWLLNATGHALVPGTGVLEPGKSFRHGWPTWWETDWKHSAFASFDAWFKAAEGMERQQLLGS